MHLFLTSLLELCGSHDAPGISFGDLTTLDVDRLGNILQVAFPGVTDILDLEDNVEFYGRESKELADALLRHYPRLCEP